MSQEFEMLDTFSLNEESWKWLKEQAILEEDYNMAIDILLKFNEVNKDYDLSLAEFSDIYKVEEYLCKFGVLSENQMKIRQFKRERLEKALQETIVLDSGDENKLQILIPMTEYAKNYWGKDSIQIYSHKNKMCFFMRHPDIGEISCLLNFPSNFIKEYRVDFIDVEGSAFNSSDARSNWNLLKDFYIFLFQKIEWHDVRKFPPKYIDREMYWQIMKIGYQHISFFPEEMIDEVFFEEWIQHLKVIPVWKNFPAKFKTKKFLQKYIEKWPNFVHIEPGEIDENLLTPDFIKEMINITPKFLISIPMKLKTKEICLQASKKYNLFLKNIPIEYRTKEIYQNQLENNPRSLRWFPKEIMTPELCLEAIENFGVAFEYLDRQMATKELLLKAINHPKSPLDII